jgi:hypothetical protein
MLLITLSLSINRHLYMEWEVVVTEIIKEKQLIPLIVGELYMV